ncbi:cyanophycinase [Alkalimonas collagenimarina]|uniref:Cyanophycinase n=1 Tax=Alkalimonas collagenimarina TaxID=400390 RepID=A0ABT9H3A2_9GAMM|nr:cyanophycinase [Alkalimonas collagenimarina]MDP4537385.1 cyanophycinase [Alkalimonas collagenimarina]
MKYQILILSACLAITACSKKEPEPRAVEKGALVMVGGSLSTSNAEVYQRFIELAGGPIQARIAVIPAASGQPVRYYKQFKQDMVHYGLNEDQVTLFPIAVKDDRSTPDVDESTWAQGGFNEELAASLDHYTAVWFLGGDQLNITKTLAPEHQATPVLQAIQALYKRGGVVAGTSAGAAMMSDIMVAAGDSWNALTVGTTDSYAGMQDQENGPLLLRSGLGFFRDGIIDQHFDRKARFGRLVVATQLHREFYPVGYGIDEDAALVYYPESQEIEALGYGGVTIIDVRDANKISNPHGYHIEGVRISFIQGADRYHVKEHRFIPNPLKSATVGAEYLDIAGPVVASGVFSRNSRLKDLIGFDLVDNKGTDEVVSYLHQGEGLGFTLRFRQDERTQGYWEYLDGMKDNSSAAFVRLDIIPSRFSITELQPDNR